MKHTKGLNSGTMKNALFNLPKAIAKFLNPAIPEIGNTEDSYEEKSDNDLEGQGNKKFIVPSSINDKYTRLEKLLGPKLSGHTNTLTKASNLFNQLQRRGKTQNEKRYPNAPNKFHFQ